MEDFSERLERMEWGTRAEQNAVKIWMDVNSRSGVDFGDFDESIRHEILDSLVEILTNG